MLGLSCTFTPGSGGPIAAAVLARALSSDQRAGTVVLVLGPGTDLDADACAALHTVADQLEQAGIGLRVAATSRQLWEQCTGAELAVRLGRDSIHPTLRAAVLAVYASCPGPGLVTPEIRAALVTPAEPVGPGGDPLGDAAIAATGGAGSAGAGAGAGGAGAGAGAGAGPAAGPQAPGSLAQPEPVT